MTPFLAILGQLFQGSPHLTYCWLAGLYSRLSDKYSYISKPCCSYIFQVSILSISTKRMEGNDNLWAFLKIHYLCSGNLRKKSFDLKFWFIQEPWIYFFVKIRNSQIFYIIKIMIFSKFAQKMYFYLIAASLYLKDVHSFIHFMPAPMP